MSQANSHREPQGSSGQVPFSGPSLLGAQPLPLPPQLPLQQLLQLLSWLPLQLLLQLQLGLPLKLWLHLQSVAPRRSALLPPTCLLRPLQLSTEQQHCKRLRQRRRVMLHRLLPHGLMMQWMPWMLILSTEARSMGMHKQTGL